MHESHLIEPIIRGIVDHTQKEGGRKVKKVRLKVGQYLGLKGDAFRETFFKLANGTIIEGAELELTDFPSYRIEVVSFDID